MQTPGLNPAKYPSYLKCMKKIFEENPEYKIVEAHNGALGVYALHAAKVNHIPVRIFHAHGAMDYTETRNYIAQKIQEADDFLTGDKS